MKTKNHYPILLALIFFILSFSAASADNSWCTFKKEIDVKKYEGHRFRYSALIKSQIEDDSAGCTLWARVDLNNGGFGFLKVMQNSTVRSNEWKEQVIEGTIDTSACKMIVGVLCQYNGKFFYDNIKLEIEEEKDKWVTAYTNNFENKEADLIEGGGSPDPDRQHYYSGEVKKGEAGEGKRCFVITGTGAPLYGINSKVGKFANVNGIKLYYEIYGEGQPLLILHGNGGSIADAAEFYPDLIKKYKLIGIDSRAQGRSTVTDQTLTYDLMASDINLLLEELKIDSVLIWGHSDGAILGILLAKDYPKKVKKVIASGPNMQADSMALFPWFINYCKNIADTSKNNIEKRLHQMMVDYPTVPYADLEKITAPILLTAGDRDIILPEHMVKLFQHIPNSQLCIMPGSTHWEEWEHKDYFMQMMTDFFDKPFEKNDTENYLK